MRGNAQRDGRPFGGSELRFYFSLFVDQSTPIKFASVCSLQRHFPTDDVSLHSGDIRNQVAKLSKIVPQF